MPDDFFVRVCHTHVQQNLNCVAKLYANTFTDHNIDTYIKRWFKELKQVDHFPLGGSFLKYALNRLEDTILKQKPSCLIYMKNGNGRMLTQSSS